MTKRLQVLLDEDELREIQATAKRHRQTTAAWVRDALRAARHAPEPADIDRKLEAIRTAARYQGPTADIDEMLAQIERGYLDAGTRRPSPLATHGWNPRSMRVTRISQGGQVQVPADVRRRWATRDVIVEDLGSSLSIRPLPDDPIEAAAGSLAGLGLTGDEMRRQWREEEQEAETRKWSGRFSTRRPSSHS